MKTFAKAAVLGGALFSALVVGAVMMPTTASADIVGTCLGNVTVGEALGGRNLNIGGNTQVNGNIRLSRGGDLTWLCQTAGSVVTHETACERDGDNNWRFVAATRLPNNAINIDC